MDFDDCELDNWSLVLWRERGLIIESWIGRRAGERIFDCRGTWSEQSLELESALDWAENFGRVRESWIGERDLYQAESLALERQPIPRQGVLDWREWFGTGIQPSFGDRG